ncbi:MAG: glutamyl-tRNA reductase [Halorhabdus sp.]
MNPCVISGLRVTQDRATATEIETACRRDADARLADLLAADSVAEAFVLQTCIRAELYVVTETPANGQEILSEMDLGVPEDVVVPMDHEKSLRHLLRVTAGLESFVTGEDQILGQVQDAIDTTREVGGIGPVLDLTLSKAVRVGKRARSQTAINEGPTSVGGAAVALVERERDLEDQTVLVIGAGEMGQHLTQAVSIRGADELLLANRTRTRADRLAEMLKSPVTVVAFDRIPGVLPDVDVVLSATASPTPILDVEAFTPSGRTFVVDLAQPRDIHPATSDLDHVVVHDLDTLKSITETARERRQDAFERLERMIDDAIDDLLEEYKRQRVDGVIAGMYQGAERIKREELATAVSKLESHGELTDEQREIVEALADALVSNLLAPPTTALRDAAVRDDWQTIATAVELFDPDIEQPLRGSADPAKFLESAGSQEPAAVTDTPEDE